MRALFTGPLAERHATLTVVQDKLARDAYRARQRAEETLHPNNHLDEIGWGIYDVAVRMGMQPEDAAAIAMDGNLRQRTRVLDDFWARWGNHLRHDFPELKVPLPRADDRLAYWRAHLAQPSFVYFVQAGDNGPVKIGKATDPERRLATLQTGSPIDLKLRDVVPGDQSVERMMHTRFADARIRGEWFGAEYLPLILAYADGLAEEAILSHDGSSTPPAIMERGTRVRDMKDQDYIRSEIERLWRDGHEIPEIAQILWQEPTFVQDEMDAMRRSTLYDLKYRVITPRYPTGRRKIA